MHGNFSPFGNAYRLTERAAVVHSRKILDFQVKFLQADLLMAGARIV
jgi:hypothetical protein